MVPGQFAMLTGYRPKKLNNPGKYCNYFPNLGELTPNQKNRGLVLPMQRKHSELIA